MIWTITNQSAMPHPFHIHGNHFYVLKVNGVNPPLNLRGRKDVVTVPPNGGSVKLITQYNYFGDSVVPFIPLPHPELRGQWNDGAVYY